MVGLIEGEGEGARGRGEGRERGGGVRGKLKTVSHVLSSCSSDYFGFFYIFYVILCRYPYSSKAL